MSSSYTQDVSNSSPGDCSREVERGDTSPSRGTGSRGRGKSGRGSREVEQGDTSPSKGTGSRGRGKSGRGRARGKAALGRGRQVGRVRGDEVWLWNEEINSSNHPNGVPFSGGPSRPIGDAVGVTDPLECFHLLLPDEFYDQLLVETNRYAIQQREEKNNFNLWSPVTKEELMAFVGLNIAIGIISLPSIEDYWSTDPILSHSWFHVIMSRDRFREILRYVHLVNNKKAPSRSNPHFDKLWKVRPILDVLSNTAPKLYRLHQQISIDESMIGTKCRLSFIQYLPKKPTKWGIKVWACCDAITGYIYSFDIYTGADPRNPNHPKGLAYGVVMKLMDLLNGKGHILYTDNFYSSPELFVDLLMKGTLATGTVRQNRRNFPMPVKGELKMSRGEVKFAYYKELTATHWYDNRDIFCLSTNFSDSLTSVRRRVGKEVKDIQCPDIIDDYNKHMGGVDLADQAMCYYSIGRKIMKWWRRIFWRMHDQAITNAFVLFKANVDGEPVVKRQKDFRMNLAKVLTTKAFELRKRPGRPLSTPLSRLTGKHFIYRSSVQRRCAVCAYKKVSP